MKKNQSGFATSAVIAAIVVIAVVIAGGIIYKHDHNKKSSLSSNSTASSSHNTANDSAPESQTSDPYSGWKTYTSTMAGYTLKYPSNWTIKSSVNNGGAEKTVLTSPGNFQVTALSFSKNSAYWEQPGSSASCGSDCTSVNQSTSITTSGYGKLDIDATTGGAGGGTMNELLLLPSTADTLVASPTKTGIYTTFKGIYQGQSQQEQTAMTSSEFLASSDTKTASLIYKSLSY